MISQKPPSAVLSREEYGKKVMLFVQALVLIVWNPFPQSSPSPQFSALGACVPQILLLKPGSTQAGSPLLLL